LQQRYNKVETVGDSTPRPGNAGDDKSAIALLKGRHAWTTEEGTVVVEQQGNMVFVSESIDAATTATLESEVFTK
jgi:hypothetical protein